MNVRIFGTNPASVHLQIYVRDLVQRGHSVTLVTDGLVDLPATVADFTARDTAARLPRGLRLLPRLARMHELMSAPGFDVTSVQQLNPDGVFAALMASGPVVPTFWGSDVLQLSKRRWYIRRLMRRAIARGVALHATSHQVESRLVELGADPARIHTFQYGIDLATFAERTVPPEPGLVVSTRGLTPFYRPEALVRAMPYLIAAVPTARLVLAGSGNPGDLEGLRDLARRLAVSERVEFPGVLSPERVGALLRRASVWASLPRTDSLALSLLEAMACGTFPVVSDLPSMHEMLDETRAAFVIDTAPDALGTTLADALARAASGAHVTRNRTVVERTGDQTVNLAAFERMLLDAAETGRAGR